MHYRFDIMGASYQLFHVAVIVAAVIHLCGLIEAFHMVHATETPCDSIEIL